MGFRFRRSLKLAPGVHLNIGKRGLSSLSVGPRGARMTMGKRGLSRSVGIPGTGVWHRQQLDPASLAPLGRLAGALARLVCAALAIVLGLVVFVYLATDGASAGVIVLLLLALGLAWLAVRPRWRRLLAEPDELVDDDLPL